MFINVFAFVFRDTFDTLVEYLTGRRVQTPTRVMTKTILLQNFIFFSDH